MVEKHCTAETPSSKQTNESFSEDESSIPFIP
jgi:hypothetical protein